MRALPFTPATLADRWQCSKATIIRMMKRGDLKRMDYPHIRFSAETVAAFEASQDTYKRGWIYFVEGAGLVKIGYTRDPIYRLRVLRATSPVPLHLIAREQGTVEDEKEFHQRFAAHRSHGEWFRIEGDLAEFLATKSVESGDIEQ